MEDFDGFDHEDGMECFQVNYKQIVNDNELLTVTRLLAMKLTENPYIVVGDYIKNLNKFDLLALTETINEEMFDDGLLIAEMLATAEGCDPSKDHEDMMIRLKQFVVLITMENLSRKGLIKVYHENMSFHPDMGSKILAEKIEGLDYDGLA